MPDLFQETNDAGIGEARIAELLGQAIGLLGSLDHVLVIVPDHSRDDDTHILFPILCPRLEAIGTAAVDVLIAQGTHPPMSMKAKVEKLGISSHRPGIVRHIFDHRWDDPDHLIDLGTLSAARVAELSGGVVEQEVHVVVNRLLSPRRYDHIFVMGATAPHEVVGYSGGSKYFFPGVAGPDVVHITHWIGAVCGIENIIGRVDTAPRRIVEAAATFVRTPKTSINSVVERDDGATVRTVGLFVGVNDFRGAHGKASECAARFYIRRVPRRYRKVIAVLDEHYDELWTGGKASYKLGGIIEDGGELIIYAPHLTDISKTHGATILKYGYQTLARICTVMAREEAEGIGDGLAADLCVAAHLTHVTYRGHHDDPEVPAYQITLASQVSREDCEQANLGWANYRELNPDDFRGREDEGLLVVDRAGKYFYVVE